MKTLSLIVLLLIAFGRHLHAQADMYPVVRDTVNGRIRFSKVINVYRRGPEDLFRYAIDYATNHPGGFYCTESKYIGMDFFDLPGQHNDHLGITRDSLGLLAIDSANQLVTGKMIWIYEDCKKIIRITGSATIESRDSRAKISVTDLYYTVINDGENMSCNDGGRVEDLSKCPPCKRIENGMNAFLDDAASRCLFFYKKFLVSKLKSGDSW